MIDLVIISYNGKELTKQAIESALSNTLKPNKIIVVDNNSSDGSVEYLSSFNYENVEIISNKINLSYGGGANQGVKFCSSKFVVISNNDVIFPPNFFLNLENSLNLLEDDFGILGFQQLYPDGQPQFSYGKKHNVFNALIEISFLDKIGDFLSRFFKKFFKSRRYVNVGFVDGAVICVNMDAFNRVGGFDEDINFYSEDADLSYRMQNYGYQTLVDRENYVIHYRGQGKNKRIGIPLERVNQFVLSRVKYCKKHFSNFWGRLYVFLMSFYYFELYILNSIRCTFDKDALYIKKFTKLTYISFFKCFLRYNK